MPSVLINSIIKKKMKITHDDTKVNQHLKA